MNLPKSYKTRHILSTLCILTILSQIYCYKYIIHYCPALLQGYNIYCNAYIAPMAVGTRRYYNTT